MEPRERLLTVLRGGIPDCVPVAPDFSNMIPARLTSPTVGLRPTSPFDCAGQIMEPSVSVPTATAANPNWRLKRKLT